MGSKHFLCVAVCCVAMGASALTGQGDSPAGPLDTVSPVLTGINVLDAASIQASFSKNMLEPGVTVPENYALSGSGKGTFTDHPDLVAGSGPQTLTWSAGEMLDGGTVAITAAGVQDLVGNPLNPAQNSATGTGIGIAPVISNLVITPLQAAAGEIVTISFTVSEPLYGDPDVAVNGNPALWVAGGKAVDYTYDYAVQESDPLGMATVSIVAVDLAGNMGTLSDNMALEIVEGMPGLPLYGWPWVALLLLALGLFTMTCRRPALECGSRASAFSFATLSRCGLRRPRCFSRRYEQESQSASRACALVCPTWV